MPDIHQVCAAKLEGVRLKMYPKGYRKSLYQKYKPKSITKPNFEQLWDEYIAHKRESQANNDRDLSVDRDFEQV